MDAKLDARSSFSKKVEPLLSLRITKFKGIPDAEVVFGDVTVFYGVNNSFKSTILEALLFISACSKELPGTKDTSDIARRVLQSSPEWVFNNNDSKSSIGLKLTTRGGKVAAQFEYKLQNGKLMVEVKEHIPPLNIVPIVIHNTSLALLEEAPLEGAGAEDVAPPSTFFGDGGVAKLRQLAYQISSCNADRWGAIVDVIASQFTVKLKAPTIETSQGKRVYSLTYTSGGVTFDITQSGKGVQNTLCLLLQLAAAGQATVLLENFPNQHDSLLAKSVGSVVLHLTREWGLQAVISSSCPDIINWCAAQMNTKSLLSCWWCAPCSIPKYILPHYGECAKDLEATSVKQVLYCKMGTEYRHLLNFIQVLGLSEPRFMSIPVFEFAEGPECVRHFQRLNKLITNVEVPNLNFQANLAMAASRKDRPEEKSILSSFFGKEEQLKARLNSVNIFGTLLLNSSQVIGQPQQTPGLKVFQWKGEIENYLLTAKDGLTKWFLQLHSSKVFKLPDTVKEAEAANVFLKKIEDSIPIDASCEDSGFHERNLGSTLLEEAFRAALRQVGGTPSGELRKHLVSLSAHMCADEVPKVIKDLLKSLVQG